jgi:hypothetical protein
MSGRLCSAEGGNFFFHPLELHLEPADLLVEFGLAGLGVARGRLSAVGEDRLGPGEQLLLPGVDLRRVDVVLAGQLVDRPVGFVGGQGDLGLEPRRMNLPLEPHGFPSSAPWVYLNHWSRKRGPLHPAGPDRRLP